jgi:hypothetical protein
MQCLDVPVLFARIGRARRILQMSVNSKKRSVARVASSPKPSQLSREKLKENADDAMSDIASHLPHNIFSWTEQPSSGTPLRNNFFLDHEWIGPTGKQKTLYSFTMALTATVDWARGRTYRQVADQLRNMAEYLHGNADSLEEADKMPTGLTGVSVRGREAEASAAKPTNARRKPGNGQTPKPSRSKRS